MPRTGARRRSLSSWKWRWVPLVPVVVLGTAACGATKAPVAKSPVAKAPVAKAPVAKAPVPASGASSCASSRWASSVYGTPHISPVPAIEAVTITPSYGGLLVDYKFAKPFAPAPWGCTTPGRSTFSSTAAMSATRPQPSSCRSKTAGAGWEPSGWTLLATLGTTNNQVEGNVRTNKAGNVIQTFFPAGFADLQPPFYWYAEQVQDPRVYLPRDNRADFSVNGTITSDCPNGVMGPYGLPDAAKLIEVKD